MIDRRKLLKIFGLTGAVAVTERLPKTLAQAKSERFTLTLLHSNDTHDHLDPTVITGKDAAGKDFRVEYGGAARVKTLIETLKKDAVNPLVVDAGDVFTGTLYGTVYKGMADLAYMEAWGVQAQTLGNHEFDNGPSQLADYLKGATFPVVSANVDVSNEPLLKGLFKPSMVIEIAGQKIGVIGVTTPDTPITSNPGPTIKFLDPLEPIMREVEALRAQGINKIILLSHLGYDVDLELATKLRGIGVIVGGHSHTPLGRYEGLGLPTTQGPYPTEAKDADGKTILITQVWEWAKFYGRLQVTFDENGVPVNWDGKVIPVTNQYKDDVRLASTMRAFMVPLDAFRKTIVGQAAVRLNGDRLDVRTHETNLGNLVADAYLWKTKGSGAVIALQNGGGVRTSVEPGPISAGKVIEIQPFGNTLYLLDLTGAEIKAALENGVSLWPADAGRFLQVAGLKYTIDAAKPAGQRIVDVQVGSGNDFKPLDLNAIYRVVTNNFTANGGDGFDVFKNAKKYRVDTYLPDNIVLNEYFAFIKNAEPKVEGRITILNEPKK